MNRRTSFLITALLLLILANIIMVAVSPPAFRATGEGFVNYMAKKDSTSTSMESFQNYTPGGAKDAYEPIGPFDAIKLDTGNSVSSWRYTSPNEPLNGYFPKFTPGPDNLFMFKDNKCKPECCGSSYSCDGGCVCTTPEQRKYVNERGGNRTSPESGV